MNSAGLTPVSLLEAGMTEDLVRDRNDMRRKEGRMSGKRTSCMIVELKAHTGARTRVRRDFYIWVRDVLSGTDHSSENSNPSTFNTSLEKRMSRVCLVELLVHREGSDN